MEHVNFKDLKSKVGVDDIAFALGYRLDRKAGIGRYIEMVLPDNEGHPKDTIIIKNPNDKANQMYFRRNGSRGGDVISLIRENANAFNVGGRNEWDTVAKVMAKYANEPIPEYGDSSYLYKAGYTESQTFDPNRFETKRIDDDIRQVMPYFQQRGISEDTVTTFSENIHRVKDLRMAQYPYFNIGFPYTEPGRDEVVGYEVRGFNGFKNKAAGTNSTTGAWIVDLSDNKNAFNVKSVYFAESAYDIMAFYQANKLKLDKESSIFVSIGGTFSEKQIAGIMSHYTNARAIDCFDNDLPGRIYGIKMVGLLENIHMTIIKSEQDVRIKLPDRELSFNEKDVSLGEFAKNVSLRYKVGQWKAPSGFKDWNDVVMNKPQESITARTKFQRNERLEQARQMRM